MQPTTRASSRADSAWRASGALSLLALWALGFELLPFAHVAAHSALSPHTHGVSSVLDASADHARAHAAEAAASERAVHEAVGLADHGAHTLLHHGVATLGAAPILALAPVAPFEWHSWITTTRDAPRQPALLRPRARSPPV